VDQKETIGEKQVHENFPECNGGCTSRIEEHFFETSQHLLQTIIIQQHNIPQNNRIAAAHAAPPSL